MTGSAPGPVRTSAQAIQRAGVKPMKPWTSTLVQAGGLVVMAFALGLATEAANGKHPLEELAHSDD